MKKLFAALAIVMFLFTGFGCGGPQPKGPDSVEVELTKTEKLLATTDRIYRNIRIVITDPEVQTLFSEKTLGKLAKLEDDYLATTKILKAFPEDAETIEKISVLATEVVVILNDVEFMEKYRPYVSAIRISINLLRANL